MLPLFRPEAPPAAARLPPISLPPLKEEKPRWREALLHIIHSRAAVPDPDSGNGSSSTASSPRLSPDPTAEPQPAKRPRANSNSFLVANLLSLAEPPAKPATCPVPPLPPPLPPFQFDYAAYPTPQRFLHNANSPFTLLQHAAPVEEAIKTEVDTSASSSNSSLSPNQPPPPPNALCVVCEDKASGFHYSVVSCEGCKGFFRRTVQKNMDYNCPKEATCPVNRITRNRCQACRFNKCLRSGMSKESVRQDGNRKRKTRDAEEEEEIRAAATLQRLIRGLHAAHSAAFPPPAEALQSGAPLADALGRLVCDGAPSVAAFAGAIPGFATLCPEDQAALQKTALHELALLWCAFHLGKEDGGTLSADQTMSTVLRLRDSFQHLQVFGEELALLAAVCLLPSTHVGLRDPAAVERLQGPVLEALRVQIALRRPRDPNAAAKLLLKISDLRAVSHKAATAS